MKPSRKIKKHLGVLGHKPSATTLKNAEQLYCKNCKTIPLYTSEKEYFIPLKWYELSKYGELCDWIICADCYTPLKVK